MPGLGVGIDALHQSLGQRDIESHRAGLYPAHIDLGEKPDPTLVVRSAGEGLPGAGRRDLQVLALAIDLDRLLDLCGQVLPVLGTDLNRRGV